MSRGRRYISIPGQLDAIWNTILCEEEGALVRETDALVHDVEGVDGLALPGDVFRVRNVCGGWSTGVCRRPDADRVDGGVGYVDCKAVRREGDTVWGDQGVGKDLHKPSARDEAVDSGFQLRERRVVEAGEADGVP